MTKVHELYRAACAADDAYQVELVRVYGAVHAGDARYMPHTDPGVLAARNAKLAADADLRAHNESLR